MTSVPLTRKSQFFLLGLITAIFFVNILARIAMAPLLPVIEKDLGLGHAGAGSPFLALRLYRAGQFAGAKSWSGYAKLREGLWGITSRNLVFCAKSLPIPPSNLLKK